MALALLALLLPLAHAAQAQPKRHRKKTPAKSTALNLASRPMRC